MPLVVICGHPCSGKSTVAAQLVDVLHAKGAAATSIVSEPLLHLQRDNAYKDVPSEKNTRALLKSTVERCIGRKGVTILDSLNNIKGYRYELWCIAKAAGTRYCMVHVDTPVDQCRAWNAARQGDKYCDEIFEDLARRFERPDARNRWDAPLFTLHPHIDTQQPHQHHHQQQHPHPHPDHQQQQQQQQPQPHISSHSPAAAPTSDGHATSAHTALPPTDQPPPTNQSTTSINQPPQAHLQPTSTNPPQQLLPPQPPPSATSPASTTSPPAPPHTHPSAPPHPPPTSPLSPSTPHPPTTSPLPHPQVAFPAGTAPSGAHTTTPSHISVPTTQGQGIPHSPPHPARSSFTPAPQATQPQPLTQPQPVTKSTFKPTASLRAAKQAQAAQAEASSMARASQPAVSFGGRTGAASLVSGTQGSSFQRRVTQASAAAAASTASWVHADGGQGHGRLPPQPPSTTQDGSNGVSLSSLRVCDPSSQGTQLTTTPGKQEDTAGATTAAGSGDQQPDAQDPLACDDQHSSAGACSDTGCEGDEPSMESVLQAIAEAMVGKPVQLSSGGTCQLTPSTATSNPSMMLGTNLLHDVDQAAQDVVDRIVEAQSCAAGGAPGRVDCSGGANNAQQRRACLLHLDQPVTLAELRRHKRAFLKLATKVTFARLHDGAAAKRTFVDYLISNVPGASRPPAEVF